MMRYRRFKTAGGSFVDAVYTTKDGSFTTSGGSQAEDIAAALGVASLTVVEGDTDPWDGVAPLLPLTPPVVPAPPDPDEELSAAIEKATDLASLKAALLGNRGAGKVKGRPV